MWGKASSCSRLLYQLGFCTLIWYKCRWHAERLYCVAGVGFKHLSYTTYEMHCLRELCKSMDDFSCNVGGGRHFLNELSSLISLENASWRIAFQNFHSGKCLSVRCWPFFPDFEVLRYMKVRKMRAIDHRIANIRYILIDIIRGILSTVVLPELIFPWKKCPHFPNDIFKCILMNENFVFWFQISLKGSIDNKATLNHFLPNSLTHMCATKGRWVK